MRRPEGAKSVGRGACPQASANASPAPSWHARTSVLSEAEIQKIDGKT